MKKTHYEKWTATPDFEAIIKKQNRIAWWRAFVVAFFLLALGIAIGITISI